MNILRLIQDGCHRGELFEFLFLNGNCCSLIEILLDGPIDSKSALVQVMNLHRAGEELLSEPMMA